MTSWWRAHSLRRRLTLWYVAAMVVVLAVYAIAVLAIVRQAASDALDQRLRGDFQWAAAMVDQTPEGGISWYEDSSLAVEEERPWVQVWSRGAPCCTAAPPPKAGRFRRAGCWRRFPTTTGSSPSRWPASPCRCEY